MRYEPKDSTYAYPLALVVNNNRLPSSKPFLLETLNIPPTGCNSLQETGKALLPLLLATYDQEPATGNEDEEMSMEKEMTKLMALISSRTPACKVWDSGYNCKDGHVSRECQKPKRVKDAAYHKEKMLLCKQEEAGVQLNAEQADWKDDTDDESDDQELEAHYMYMAHIQEVTPDPVDNSGPIFNDEPMHKVQNNNDNYNVFAMENEHPEQPESSNDIYLAEHGDTNITIDSLDICYDRDQDDQDDTDDLDQERDLLASLIQKLKCEIDDSKNRNKFLESSNKALVDKLKGEIEDFKTKNKSLESSNNHFKEANNELSKTNQLMFKDLKKFQAELDKYNDVNYASKVEIDCAKAKGDLMSYKIDFEKSSNAYTRQINDLNQTISDMKKELCAHQETISIMSQAKEAQIKLYKTREDNKELDDSHFFRKTNFPEVYNVIIRRFEGEMIFLSKMASDHVSFDPGPQCSTMVLEQESLSLDPQSQENVSQTAETVTTSNELELLYSPMFSELLNGTSPVVSKSSTVHAADNPDKRQQHNTTHTSTTTDVADPPPLNIQSTHQTHNSKSTNMSLGT
ncbi:hypothetical protein Tco_1210325 [Tanacetum coccineum]